MNLKQKRHFIGIARLIRDSERIDLFAELHRRCLEKLLPLSKRKKEYPRIMSFVLCFDKDPTIKALTGQYTKTGSEKKVEQAAITRYLKSFAVEGKDKDGKNPTKVKGYEHIPAFYAWLCFYHKKTAKEFHDYLRKQLNNELPFNRGRNSLLPEHFHKKKSFFKSFPEFDNPKPPVQLKAKEEVLERIEDLKNVDSDADEDNQSSEATETISGLGLVIYHRREHHIKTSHEMAFQQRRTKFVGRETEQSRLTEFMTDDRKFLWWQIAGTAGQGKSRLALQLAENFAAKDWEVGFVELYSNSFNGRIRNYSFKRATLIIIDDVSSATKWKQLVETVSLLAVASKKFGQSIRLILLDRQPYDYLSAGVINLHSMHKPTSWHSKLIQSLSSETGYIHLYNKIEALTLKTHQEETKVLNDIAESWAKSKLGIEDEGDENGQNILTSKQLREVNKFLGLFDEEANETRKRTLSPLLVILATDAVMAGEIVSKEKNSFEQLLDYALDHDAKIMFGEPKGTLEGYGLVVASPVQQNMALFANIVKRYDVNKIEDKNDIEQTHKLLGYAIEANVGTLRDLLRAREPNLMAEYQVLRLLDHDFQMRSTNDPMLQRLELTNQVIQRSWEHNPQSMNDFIIRAVDDFPRHHILHHIILLSAKHSEPSLWCDCVDKSIDIAVQHEDYGRASIEFGVFGQYLSDNINNVSFVKSYASATVNICGMLCFPADQGSTALKHYNRLHALTDAFPDEPFLRECLSKVAGNLGAYYGKKGDFDSCYAFFHVQSVLAKNNSEETMLEKLVYVTRTNIIGHLCEHKKLDAGRASYDDLYEFALQNPHPFVVAIISVAARHLIVAYGKLEEKKEAELLFDGIKLLANRVQDVDQVNGIYNELVQGAI